jgi:CCR4-NOT transcription complex subunit 4
VSTPHNQQKPGPATPGPVAPAVPIFNIGPRVSTPKVKPKDEPFAEMKAVKEANNAKTDDLEPDEPPVTDSQKAEGSNSGIRVPKSARTTAEPTIADTLESTVIGRAETRAGDNSPTLADAVPSMEISAESVPEKLDPNAVREAKLPLAVQSPVADQTPALVASIVATPPATSRPGTPATPASRSSESSVMRPKTIRITSTISQKPDTTPASAVTEKSITLPSVLGKQRSRQPSVSSISRSRPSTPAISDHVYSNDVSRASSPPPSIVGSAPERSKTKNQVRKERKSKAKEATETNSDGPPTPVERKVEEQKPIVARQKKKRKAQDRSTVDGDSSPTVAAESIERKIAAAPESTRVTRQQSNKNTKAGGNSEQANMRADHMAIEAELEMKLTVPVAGKEDKVTSSATPKEPYTLNQLLIDSGKANAPEAFKTLLDEHISNIQTLFSQLFDSKQLDQSSALFNLPPLTSYRLPPDSRRGADYLDGNGYTMSSPFGEVYLDSKQKKELQQGSAVRISDANRPNDLLRRSMITKNGRVYRHLSQEEEERALMLERRQEEDEQVYGELGAREMLKVDEADLMNIQGGLDELLKHGDRHGISWVMDDSENIDGDMDEEDDADYPVGDDEAGELANLAGGWQAADPLGAMTATANSKEHGGARHHAQKKSLNLRAMDIEKLQRTIRETQTEMEHARKEMEAVEKKWVKKGKEAAKWRETILKGKVMVGSD